LDSGARLGRLKDKKPGIEPGKREKERGKIQTEREEERQ